MYPKGEHKKNESTRTMWKTLSHYVKRIPLTNMNYEQWNQAIISYFFEECEPGEIAFLQANDETLSEIAELSDFDVPDAAESLITVVKNEVVKAGDRVNFWNIEPTNRWISFQSKEPPQVAFLALTVLAASRMESSDSGFHTNYYVRLNELLFDKSIQGIPKGIKYQIFEGPLETPTEMGE